MNDRIGSAFVAGVKAWVAGAATASLAMLMWALVEKLNQELNFAVALDAIMKTVQLSIPIFSMILLCTAVPCAAFLWLVHRLRFEVPFVFVLFGAALGAVLGGSFYDLRWQGILIGSLSGLVAWWFKTKT